MASIASCFHSLLSCAILYTCIMLKFVSSFTLSMYLLFGLPLSRFPNTIPVKKSFRKPCRLTASPANASFLWSMQFSSRSVVFVLSCSKMLSFVRRSVQHTCNSQQYLRNSKVASHFLSLCFTIEDPCHMLLLGRSMYRIQESLLFLEENRLVFPRV